MGVEFSEKMIKHNMHQLWNDTRKEAYLYDKLDDNIVQCRLCPRTCLIGVGKVGFCKVRKNIDGVLYAQSYGKATHIAVERIETEAVFNYAPGSKILSLGNFGCNLNCDYCQNWIYSQFEYTPPESIHEYSSDDIIEYALKQNIEILSWTYNDPAVWFEFVLDTARVAKARGLKSLFKSAFFLSAEAVEALSEVIDIFAISIKAMDESYYSKFTKGWLSPVLDNARFLHKKGRYLEISNLVVTDLTNNDASYDQMIDFVKNQLSPEVPLHFTRFHPDYKYRATQKTPVVDVMRARRRALDAGLRYSYIGNAFSGEGLNTYCPACKVLLIERYGLSSYVKDTLTPEGVCARCGCRTGIILASGTGERTSTGKITKTFRHEWTDADEFLIHVQLDNPLGTDNVAIITRVYSGGRKSFEPLTMDRATASHRFILSRTHTDELAFVLEYPQDLVLEVFRIDDRAFYPSSPFYTG